jgi:hypothetical protein
MASALHSPFACIALIYVRNLPPGYFLAGAGDSSITAVFT